jgi:hypothetical protein
MQAILSGSFHSSSKTSPFPFKERTIVELSNGRPGLEQFHNSRAVAAVVQGGFFLAKKPLGGSGGRCSNCGTAVARNFTSSRGDF